MTIYDGPNDLEVAQLEVTRGLIDYDHQDIAIIRPRPNIRRPDGTVVRESGPPTVLAPQKLFFGGVTLDDRREVNWQGKKVVSDWVLIGMPGADFKEDDQFSLWGRDWWVIEIHPDGRWQRKAWVVSRG